MQLAERSVRLLQPDTYNLSLSASSSYGTYRPGSPSLQSRIGRAAMASSHEKSYELLPHDSVAIQHHHDHGRPSHDEACLALAGLPNQAYWSPPPPIPFYPNTTLVGHFGLYHNDTCVNNNHCFVNGSDGANQRVLTNLQQPLSSGQSQCQSQPQSWHWESDPNIGSMAEDEASRATDFCDGKCSQDGAMCKDTCHGDCEDADKELCGG